MTTHRRWMWGVIALIATAAGCGFPAQREASPVSDDDLPVGLRPGTTSDAGVDGSERATIWLVDGDRLVSARHDVRAPASVASIAEALLAGPTELEQRRGLRSALPDPAVAVGAASERGQATVELNESFTEIAPEDQLLGVGQFVLTLTDAPGVGSVAFEIAGKPIAVPLPTGESSDGPVYREQYLGLTAASGS